MRIVVAPDKFAGTMSALQVAEAFATGWQSVRPGDEVDIVPLADGGPGFLECLHAALGGELSSHQVPGPLGEPVAAQVLAVGSTSYVEAAMANGLHLVAPPQRDPLRATTYGVGVLIAAAVHAGARRVVVGLGGSATNDGGAGVLAALGARAFGARDADLTERLAAGPAALAAVARVELAGMSAALQDAELAIATDVDNPLLGPEGASYGFGPQKGAAADALPLLEAAMRRWERLCRAAGAPPQLATAAGAGAAGGLGYGLLVAGARRVAGIETVMRAVDLAGRCRDAELVITGEGAFDWQSLHGKVVSGVVAAARGAASAPPVIVVCGRNDVAERQWRAAGITEVRSLLAAGGSVEAALTRGPELLAQVGADLAGRSGRGRGRDADGQRA